MPNVVTKIYSLGKEVLFIMKKRKVSKVIAVALAAIMVIGMVPMMAFADDTDLGLYYKAGAVTNSDAYNFSLQAVGNTGAVDSYINYQYDEVDTSGKVTFTEGENMVINMSTGDGFTSTSSIDDLGWYISDEFFTNNTQRASNYGYVLSLENEAWTAELKDADGNDAGDVTMAGFPVTTGANGSGLAGESGKTIAASFTLPEDLEKGTYTLDLSYIFHTKYHSGQYSFSSYYTLLVGTYNTENAVDVNWSGKDTITIEVVEDDGSSQGGTTDPEPTPDPTPTPDPEPEPAGGLSKEVNTLDSENYNVSLKHTDENSKVDAYVNFEYEDVAQDGSITYKEGQNMAITMAGGAYDASASGAMGWYVDQTLQSAQAWYVGNSTSSSTVNWTATLINDDTGETIASITDGKASNLGSLLSPDYVGEFTETNMSVSGFPKDYCYQQYGLASDSSDAIKAVYTLPELSVGTYSLELGYQFSMAYDRSTLSHSSLTFADGNAATWNYSDTIDIIVVESNIVRSDLGDGISKVKDDENITISGSSSDGVSFDVETKVSDLLYVNFDDVTASDSLEISFNYTGLDEDFGITEADGATEVSFGIENFTWDYTAGTATISKNDIGDVVVDLLAAFGMDLGSIGSLVSLFLQDLDINAVSYDLTPTYSVYAVSADGQKYLFDVAYDEETVGNATFTCENLPEGSYSVVVEYTYDITFDYDTVYTYLESFLSALGLDLGELLGMDLDLNIPVSGTVDARSVSSEDSFAMTVASGIGMGDATPVTVEEELGNGLYKIKTGNDVSFVGSSDEAGVIDDVKASVLGLIDIDFENVTVADDLNISFNYAGLNADGTLTVGEDATVASFGIENFTCDYSALATISRNVIGDEVADLLADETVMGLLGEFLDEDTMGTIDMFLPLLGMVLDDLVLTADNVILTPTYVVTATAEDGTEYTFTVVYDAENPGNAEFVCSNIPAGDYEIKVDYVYDISFDYDVTYTAVSEILAMFGLDLGEIMAGLSLDIPVNGTVESIRTINSSDTIAATILVDIADNSNCEHEFYIVDSQAATCTEEGWVLYACSICGEQFTQYTAALGHDFVDGVCTRCGAIDPDYEAPTASASGSSSSTTTSSGENEGEDEEFEEVEDEDEFTEVEEDEFEVVEDEDLTSPSTGASMAAIATAMAFAAAGVVVVTRKKKEDEE